MKRYTQLIFAALAGMAIAASVGVFGATRAIQLDTYKKTNSSARALEIIDSTNPLISDNLATIYTHTQSNTTLAATTLIVTLEAGKTYFIRATLPVTAAAAGGLKIDFNGGTATATSFEVDCDLYAGTTFSASTRQTALTTGAGATAALTDIECKGQLVVNAAGTFGIRAAQNASDASDSSIRAGAWLTAQEL